ncbi:hypothetical protein SDC9_179653 [bioreactor metagenome]|uniref:Uncharacterized protein n=1 Tax=bioreactor metagenome TaxID=1076179 RepID=A0A645GZH7_9ZZZZ
MNESTFYNQLPVSLFKNNVDDNSRIFEGFLDIWGIDEAKEEVNIFELKKPDNYPLGIISELLFYTLFQRDILDKKIIYKNIENIKDYRGIKSLINSNCTKVKGYFLTTKLHPLIDEKLITFMNFHLKSYDIQLESIKYCVDKEGNIESINA